jgi:hypothetical protein
MLSHDEWKELLGGELSDDEVEEVVRSLRAFLDQFLDDYFRDEYESDDV